MWLVQRVPGHAAVAVQVNGREGRAPYQHDGSPSRMVPPPHHDMILHAFCTERRVATKMRRLEEIPSMLLRAAQY